MKPLLYLGPSGRQFWCKGKHGWQPTADVPGEPVWVVTDFAEESFTEIEMPRLFGRDRSTYIARQLATRFPDTPYRAVLAPPRLSGVMEKLAPTHQLFLAINNAERLDSEIGNTPVTGIWPISLLLAHFCHSRKLPVDLLIVLPRPEALRIVYLKNHSPVITRLAPCPNTVSAQIEEIIRTRRYLENTRLIERDRPCPVLLMGTIENYAMPLSAAQFQLVPPPHPWDRQPPQDWLHLLFDLALHSPAGQVAPITRRIDHLAQQLKKAALATSALGLIAAVWAASGNLQVVFDTLKQREQSQATTQQLLAQIATLEEKTASFGVSPELLRQAITLHEEEIASVPALEKHLASLANSLVEQPDARLKHLEWRLLAASEAPCSKSASTTAESNPAPATPPEGTAPAPEARRKVEIALEIALPNTAGPGEQARRLRKISEKLGSITGSQLIQDPVKELDQGTLQGSASRESDKKHAWCLALPGDTRAKPAVPGGKP